MASKTFNFKPDKKFKQGYVLTDENREVVYEAIMTKWTLFLPFKFKFVNHLTNKTEEHKVGHTVTSSFSGLGGGLEEMLTTKSSFKFDGKKIWDYLHEMGVRLSSSVSKRSLGMTYTMSLNGEPIATLATSMPDGKKFVLTAKCCYDITTDEKYLDLAFLGAFALARTEQLINE